MDYEAKRHTRHAPKPQKTERSSKKQKDAAARSAKNQRTMPSTPPIMTVRNREAGMFSLFFSVAHALFSFENGTYDGVNVDFAGEGFYYEAAHGNNWWDYYCEPIHVTKQDRGLFQPPIPISWGHDAHYPRLATYRIIQKYIKPKKHIIEKVDQFVLENFSNKYVIGIHYRGTDKSREAPKVAYKTVIDQIEHMLSANFPIDHTKIFIATDEMAFLEHAIDTWGDLVCCTDSTRSTNQEAVHSSSNRSAYKVGEEAIIDMLLLSRCNTLVRCRSNLSLWSGYFNPWMPIVDLNKGFNE